MRCQDACVQVVEGVESLDAERLGLGDYKRLVAALLAVSPGHLSSC